MDAIVSMGDADIGTLTTPCLLLDQHKMDRNIARFKGRLAQHRVTFNPHIKTAKSLPIADRLMEHATGPCTVSTLAEAEHLAAAGVKRILYAVGIAPQKLARAAALRAQEVDLVILVDSAEQARVVADSPHANDLAVLIEVDVDGHRAGVPPDARDSLVAIAQILIEAGVELRGVLTHAGDSYNRPGPDALRAIAEQERAGIVAAAGILRDAGFPCPVVSLGSTPTAHFGASFEGVTEVRAGVFVFCDLVMAGLGVCTLDDIAISVLATVIGHQPEKGWIIVDAGWMALSRDRGTSHQEVDQGYGVVCDVEGHPFPDVIVAEANQEHGIVAIRSGSDSALPDLPIGSYIRILPNHACATAAQHKSYWVLSEDRRVVAEWERFGGW